MGVKGDESKRRETLVTDIEQVAQELSRLITEAISLSLPVWAEVRSMPAELSRWKSDLRQIIP